MRKVLLLVAILFAYNITYSQVESDFEKFKQQQQEEMQSMRKSDSTAMLSLEKEYQDYIKAEQEAYDNEKNLDYLNNRKHYSWFRYYGKRR